MPVYAYKGVNHLGRTKRGTLQAENLRVARLKLKKEGIYVSELKNKSLAKNQRNLKSSQNRKVKIEELALATRQLASLLHANIPLVESLNALSEQVENPILQAVFTDCKNAVNEGESFYKTLSKYPKIFNKTYIYMCQAGEASGTLDVILIRLAEFTESANELKQRLQAALTYPLIMIIMTIAILILLFLFVIPKMQQVFSDAIELELPSISIAVFAISGWLVNYWYIFAGGVFFLTFMFFNWKNSEKGRPQYDTLLLKLGFVGKMVRMVAVARFSRTLATLLKGGVPMLVSMDIVRNVVNNEVLAKAIDEARENISEGESIALPLKKSGQFPPIVIHMISIGEKTGELEAMLEELSKSFEFQVKNSVDRLTSLISPIVLVFMAIVVGVIVWAVLMPILQLSDLG